MSLSRVFISSSSQLPPLCFPFFLFSLMARNDLSEFLGSVNKVVSWFLGLFYSS